ncbi:PAS domain S-box protein [Methanomicrobium antiquum]|uniref:PAS domain S-box protein n=1 Tax=Methanomicrobium antiquum TaxID=487686 RepID=A0AAF0JMB2_9EURY|nr:PAS domain S-box protein [Methanomicrobium antiquum]MDD3978023.1 PAS domain S-box protein [Methanomicrobium sp.]WFN36355.1 PAS domain S-box protein [Methanomicrobium antiquum]
MAPGDDELIKEDLLEIRKRIIGFGEESFRKSYYPMLQFREDELKRFRIALDNTSDLVFILDYPSLKIIDTNCHAEDVLEYSKKELFEKKITDLSDNDSAELISKMFLSGKVQAGLIDSYFTTKSGKKVHMEVSFSLSGLGRETYAAAVCRDITERERLEYAIRESEMQYRTTINTLKDVIVVIDSSLDIVISNNSFDRLCRKAGFKGSAEVENLKQILKYLYWANNRNFDSVSDYLQFYEINMKLRRGDDVSVYSVRNMPIFEGGIFKQSVLYMRDITENIVMDKMKKEAFLQIDKNMEQFAVLNDHIRNPLQVILGIVDLECPCAVEKIMPYISEIDRIVNKLDNGWIESEKVRKMIAKHYGVSIIDNSDVEKAINYLKKIPEY